MLDRVRARLRLRHLRRNHFGFGGPAIVPPSAPQRPAAPGTLPSDGLGGFGIPQIIPLSFNGQGANTQATVGPLQLPPTGFLSAIQPVLISTTGTQGGTSPPPTHGRYYLQVWLVVGTSSTFNMANVVACVWAGYIGNACATGSFLNQSLAGTFQLWATITTGSYGTTGDVFSLNALVTVGVNPVNATIFYEAPGSGRGEVCDFHPSNPAAGSDWMITVPNYARWHIFANRASLTTSTQAATRIIRYQMQGVKGHQMWNWNGAGATGWLASQTAGNGGAPYSITDAGMLEGLINYTNPNQPPGLPSELTLQAGCVLIPNTAALQTLDQWSNWSYIVEEWAMPAP